MEENFDIDLAKIPNSDKWILAAKDAASHPDNFSLWEHLVTTTEYLPSCNQKVRYKFDHSANKEEKKLVLLVYENILVNYPYLEKYWVNYALWFYKFNNISKSISTFERALNIIPHSLLIWNEYIDLKLKLNSNNEQMLGFLERARTAIGFHFYSSSFYDKYLNFLQVNKLEREYYFLLRRVIEVFQYDYLKYFQIFLGKLEAADLDSIKYMISEKDLLSDFQYEWSDLLDVEKFSYIKAELKKKYIDLFINTQFHSWKFYHFEKMLSNCQYFKPNTLLNRLQLQTWRKYIEYVENLNLKVALKEKEVSLYANNKRMIDLLYNRCLVSTSMYSYFWIKYSNYYLNYNEIDTAKQILIKGIYMNPVKNLKLRTRLIDLNVLTLDFDIAKKLVIEGLKLFPHNFELFSKYLEVEHFLKKSSIENLVVNKLNEIASLGNTELENQFDYLFFEILNFGSLSIPKIHSIFEKFPNKRTVNYLKARAIFFRDYYIDANSDDKISRTEDNNVVIKEGNNWMCEYF